MALTVDVALNLTATLTGTSDFGTPTHRIPFSWSDSLSSGTGLDASDQIWADERTLSATSEDLDLAASLTNGLGQTVTFAKVKGIIIYNKATTAGYTLAVGGAASNQFINWVANSSDIVNIGPNGLMFLWNPSLAGYAVTASTGDLLKINSGSNAITYQIIVIGTTA